MDYHGNILLRTNRREDRQKQKAQFCSGGRGKAETESSFVACGAQTVSGCVVVA